MKKTILAMFTASLMLMTVFGACFSVSAANTLETNVEVDHSTDNLKNSLKTIVVPDDYPTIQDAVDAASDGDIIQVREGTYRENIIIWHKQLTIEPADDGTPIIEGTGELAGWVDPAVIIIVLGASVHLSGFEIQNPYKGYCIHIYKSDHNTITQNTITHLCSPWDDCGIMLLGGILLDQSNNNMITDNIIKDNGYSPGVQLDSSDHNTITDNIFKNNGVGIGIGASGYSSNFNEIAGNKITDNYYGGIAIEYSSNNNIECNIIKGHINIFLEYVGGGWLILLWSASENTITGNIISKSIAYGIWLFKSSNRNTITDNSVTLCLLYGIFLESSNYNTVKYNTLKGNGEAIKEVNCEGNDISDNDAKSSSQPSQIEPVQRSLPSENPTPEPSNNLFSTIIAKLFAPRTTTAPGSSLINILFGKLLNLNLR